MSGSQASQLTPLSVGVSDSGDFSSWLGRPVQSNEETYVMVQANVAIASGSNGKQLVTAVSSGQPSWSVSLATGIADHTCCGAIPWTLTGPIVSGAYFLAVRDSALHVMLMRGTFSGTVNAGDAFITGTGADLIPIFTQAAGGAVSGLSSTGTGVALLLSQFSRTAGVYLSADTGVVAVSGWVRYKAPFRGAD